MPRRIRNAARRLPRRRLTPEGQLALDFARDEDGELLAAAVRRLRAQLPALEAALAEVTPMPCWLGAWPRD
ncbi:MAG: hypothetical protein J2P50_19915 [Hyphomicrobiaceae bacterium]|nr:hypothetical protein [Hyphomicrobiaceae bacterium]